MKDFRNGLVVGKFCPLHRGHQYLLDHAQRQCERLVIISYTKPGFAGFEAERRERWLAALYPEATRLVLDDAYLADACRRLGLAPATLPHNDAPDQVHRDFVAWLLREVLHVEVDAVFTSEVYGDGFAEALTQAQVGRGGRAVVHVAVDPARTQVPVSGTAIRANRHGLRGQLDPRVYRDLVRRVAILGGECTGKSTLAADLATELGTHHAAEYGRELWEQKHGALVLDDLLHIAQVQVAREETLALQANRFLVCDTTPLTTMLYSQAMYDCVCAELEQLARRPYDVVLLCAPDIPFVQDGTRREEAFRHWQHAWYVRELEARRIAFHRLTGGWRERMGKAMQALSLAGD